MRHASDDKGESVFRSVGVIDGDRQRLTSWRLAHQQGREITAASFGAIHFEWRDAQSKLVADFFPSTEPGGIYSAKAIDALKEFLEANGDIHPLEFVDSATHCFLFDCWSRFEADPDAGFSFFDAGRLKSIMVKAMVVQPDIFIAKGIPGLFVSERFKAAAEAAGLTGMTFTEVEVIQND